MSCLHAAEWVACRDACISQSHNAFEAASDTPNGSLRLHRADLPKVESKSDLPLQDLSLESLRGWKAARDKVPHAHLSIIQMNSYHSDVFAPSLSRVRRILSRA